MAAKKGFFDSIFKKFGSNVYDFTSYQECLDALQSPDPIQRVCGLEHISRLHVALVQDPNPFEVLMRNDDDLQVQEAAMNLLGEIGTEQCLFSLIEMLAFPDQWLRARAATVLSQMHDPRALQAIKEAYNGIKPEYQQSVRRAISSLEEALSKQSSAPKDPEHSDSSFTEDSSITFNTPGSGSLKNQPVPAFEFIDDDDSTQPQPFNTGAANQNFQQIQYNKPKPHSPSIYQNTYSERKSYGGAYGAYNDSEAIIREMLEHHLHMASSAEVNQSIAGAFYKSYAEKRDEAEKYLLKFLNDPALPVRLQVIQALITLNKPYYYLPQFKSLLNDPSPEICLMGIVAISGVEDAEIAEKILPLITSRHEKLQKFSQNYFLIHNTEEMAEIILKNIERGDEEFKMACAALLAKMNGDSTRNTLKKALQKQDLSDNIISAILEKLPPNYSDVVISSLPALILRKDEKLFNLTLRFLCNQNDILVKDYVLSMLSSQNNTVKGRSLSILGELKLKQHAKDVFALLNDSSDYVRLQAARAIGEMNAVEYSNTIFAAINNDKSNVNKMEYVKVILSLQGVKAVGPLVSLLSGAAEELKCTILESISRFEVEKIDTATVAKQLMPLLNSSDIRVFFYTVLILVKFGIREFPYDKQKMLQMLWSLAKEARNPAKIRRDSLFCIYTIAGEGSRSILKTIVQNDRDESVVIMAMQYLAELGGHDVMELLARHSANPSQAISSAAVQLANSLKSAQETEAAEHQPDESVPDA